MSSETIQDVVNEELVLGEEMRTFASGLAGAAPNALEVTAVVLTSHCLMLVRSSPSLGYELGAVYELSACWMVKHKALPDGANLLILRHKTGLLYLHFTASWQPQAKRMMDAFAPAEPAERPAEIDPPAEPGALAEKEVVVNLGDTFSLVSEFAGLGSGSLDEDIE